MGNLTQAQVALHHRSPLFSFSVSILYIMPFSLTCYAVNCSDWISLRFIKEMARNPDQLVYNSAWLSFPFQFFSHLFYPGCIICFHFPFGLRWLSLYFFTYHLLWEEWKHLHSLEFICHVHSAVSPLSLFLTQQDELQVYSQFLFLSGREGNLRLPLSESTHQSNSFHFKCFFKTTPLAEVSQ